MSDPAPLTPLTDAFFDALVDGGLPPNQIREAIKRLDREPDGWKRCALAFLEAQCWRESFPAIEDDLRGSPGDVTPTPRSEPSSARTSTAKWRRFALAACLGAMAFSLGWWLHPDRRPLAGREWTSPVVAEKPVRRSRVVGMDDSPDRAEVVPGATRVDEPPAITTVGRLRVGTSEGSPAVPIMGGPGIDERWVADQPPPITEHQIALLQQGGYQVDRQRRLITATLRDGRRLAVPIDRFRVRYTGNGPL